MNIRTHITCLFTTTLISCGEPKFEHLFVKNNTDKPLIISAKFVDGTTKLTPLTLEPGAENGWRFLTKGAELIGSFQQLTAKTDKCGASFSKEQLRTMILKDGAYRLVLNSLHTKCGM